MLNVNINQLRGVARNFEIPFRTLTSYCRKVTDEELRGKGEAMLGVAEAAHRKVLSDDQEKELYTYLN